MSVALLHAMHCLSCRGPRQIEPCTMHHQSTLVLLICSLAHCSCKWPIHDQLDQAVLAACTRAPRHPLQVQKLKLSQLFFECSGIYGID